ncbi:UNVERIFIED_CONTAM: hypothetical protein FKN15_029530 [Acipenser sinensis]
MQDTPKHRPPVLIHQPAEGAVPRGLPINNDTSRTTGKYQKRYTTSAGALTGTLEWTSASYQPLEDKGILTTREPKAALENSILERQNLETIGLRTS